MKSLELKKDIYWVGSLDPGLRIFDIIMQTQFGTTYNSYIVKGSEKIALFETVKAKFFDEYLEKLKEIIDDPAKIDYIVVDHTEPDHAGSVEMLLDYAPNAKVVGSESALEFLAEIANREIDGIVVEHGDTIDLGNKTLKFVSAPFLHWPDSIYTYIPEDRVLLTCDSFGSHYSFEEVLYSKIPTEKMKDYESALLYYYTAIFGPFKNHVINALEKIKDYNIDMVCPGHGPVLDENPQKIMNTYREWSTESNPNEKKKIIVPYVSAYGYTEELAQNIIKGIQESGDFEIKSYNLNIANYGGLKTEIMNEIYWADGILLGTSTINGDALPPIWDIALGLNPIVHGGRGKVVSAFGSYGWSGEGVPNIISRLDQLRMLVPDGYRVKFKPSGSELEGAVEYGRKFAEYVLTGKVPAREEETTALLEDLNPSGEVKKWRCVVCGEIIEGVLPPKVCPVCGVGQELFEIVEETGPQEITSEKEDKILIVGSGAAALSAAEALRARNKNASIELLSKAMDKPYYRPSISDYLSGDIPEEEFYLKSEDWYKENDVKLTLNTLVESINSTSKEVKLGNGEVKSYDKLIFASGSRANIPRILGVENKGCFTLRGKYDADRIREYTKTAKKAIIIGGGVLGLEAAGELFEMGLDVTVIEKEARIFPRQLDEEGSKLVEEKLKSKGITVYKNHFVKKVNGEGTVTGVSLDNDKVINADMIIISAGIACNKELAERTGIITNRGILVNENMETNIEGIYACGDVAEYQGIVQGLWKTALDQGTVAGANAAEDRVSYKEETQPVTFTGLDMDIFSIGDIGNDPDKIYQISEYNDCENDIYKKIYFNKDKFVGGVLIGDVSGAGALINGLKNGSTMAKLTKKVF